MTNQSPAAIVRSAADLRVMAQAIRSEIFTGQERRRDCLDRFRRAGLLLHKAKQEVGHGNWKTFCDQHLSMIGTRELQRYMKLAEVEPGADLVEEWERICGTKYDMMSYLNQPGKEEPANGVQPPRKKKARQKAQDSPGATGQTGGSEESSSPFVDPWECPEDLQTVLAEQKRWEKAAKRLRGVQKCLYSLERAAAWRTLMSWENARGNPHYTKRSLSALIATLALEVEQIVPTRLCPSCKGVPPGDAAEEFCRACGGRGYLLACEVKEKTDGEEAGKRT